MQGQTTLHDVYWYGRQQGEVAPSYRKLKVRKPRLRRHGIGIGGEVEVEVPAYARLRKGVLGEHVVRLMMRGVSTRNCEPVLAESGRHGRRVEVAGKPGVDRGDAGADGV